MAETKDKAYTFIFNEILDKILQLSENPSQFADYLTQQIREIIGARTIVIAIIDSNEKPKIFSVFPKRRKEWVTQLEVLHLIEISFAFENIQFLDYNSTAPGVSDILQNLDIERSIAIPLIASGVKVGSILLFDIMDSFGTEAVLDLLTRLSGISALIIRNSVLYHNLEETVAIRTQELQRKNEELNNANLQLKENIIKIQDINSQLEESKQKAEKEEEQTRSILQTAMDGFWKVDFEGKIIEVNEIACEILGFSKSELLKLSLFDIATSIQKDVIYNRIKRIIEIGEERFESVFECKSGRKIDVEVSVKTHACFNFFVVFFRDITERKQIEKSIRESEEKYRLLFESINDSVFISELNETDKTTKFIQVNDVSCERLGYSREELLSKTAFDINSEKAKQTHQALLGSILEKKHAIVETEHVTKDGKIIPVEISTKVTQFKNKTIFHTIARDITERKQWELELIKAKEHAEESDRLKTAFLQNMSHEIRTPMNAIMGFSDLLVKNFDNKNKLQRFADIIGQRCNDLLDIINDILDIAKIESGQLPVNHEECNLKELFAEISTFFNEYQIRLGKQQIKFSLQALCDPADYIIITDKVKLKQIFINLIGNAFKFTEKGKIEGGCKFDDNHNLLFYVTDTGIGIPADKQAMVFERFAQVHQGAKMNIGGTGLGLSIVKGLVGLLGGQVFLESEPNKGSTFSFTFPFKTSQAAVKKQSGPVLTDINVLSNKTILIVEDDIFNAEYIKEILSNKGLIILHTEYGKEAVEISISQPIDLVLMDIRLPDINGYEATRQIRLHKPTLKIIAQTAYAAHDEQKKAFDAGFTDYISKPSKPDLLLFMINSHLANQ